MSNTAYAQHVDSVIVTDPDTHAPVAVEIYKDKTSSALFGVDASFLEQLVEDDGKVTEPFNNSKVVLIDDKPTKLLVAGENHLVKIGYNGVCYDMHFPKKLSFLSQCFESMERAIAMKKATIEAMRYILKMYRESNVTSSIKLLKRTNEKFGTDLNLDQLNKVKDLLVIQLEFS